jgi:hypothetical protein
MKRKYIYRFAFLVIVGFALFALIEQPISGSSDKVLRQFFFDKTSGVVIDIYTSEAFEERFGDNPAVPKTDEEVLELAQELYTPEGIQVDEECGEDPVGVLFAALTNPEISDQTRDEVDELVDAAAPPLPETYTSGHFRFLYTTSDSNPDHNVTLAAIQTTATILNNAWNDYAVNFVEPKHYVDSCGNKRIDVKVYYLGQYLYGQTSSFWDHMELNSKQVVMNNIPCKRETTPVHELFHRCQYTYGYVTGTSIDKWAVEGTASWSQKHMASHVGDWMDRMDQGLAAPDKKLIGSSRSYDACHFWVYFGQYGGGSEADLIEDVWAEYSVNGNDMRSAAEDVSWSRHSRTLDHLVQLWSFTNFSKDFNIFTWADYVEDEWTRTCDGVTHGPLDSVYAIPVTLNSGVPYNSGTQTVQEYGADYYVITLGAGVSEVTFSMTGTGSNFGYAYWALDGSTHITYARSPAGGTSGFGPVTWDFANMDKIAIMVVGTPNSGSYSITASEGGEFACASPGSCIGGYTQGCEAGDKCYCFKLAEGGGVCLDDFYCDNTECDTSAECPAGSACIVDTCCSTTKLGMCASLQCTTGGPFVTKLTDGDPDVTELIELETATGLQ